MCLCKQRPNFHPKDGESIALHMCNRISIRHVRLALATCWSPTLKVMRVRSKVTRLHTNTHPKDNGDHIIIRPDKIIIRKNRSIRICKVLNTTLKVKEFALKLQDRIIISPPFKFLIIIIYLFIYELELITTLKIIVIT